jgi:hypothetical protein
MTNLDLIRAALRLGKVLSEGDEPTNEQAQDGLSTLNDLFADWAANDIDIGHYRQSSLSAESPIYEDAVRAAKHNLAIVLCAEYEIEPPPGVLAIAISTHDRLQRDAAIAALREADMSHLPGVVERSNIESG